jgi:hypothetical protein
MNILTRLFSSDYDPSFINKMDRHAIGGWYRYQQKAFMLWFYFFILLFCGLGIVYALGIDGKLGENLKIFLSLPTVGLVIIGMIVCGAFPTLFMWWALGKYGENTKSIAIDYFVGQSQYYQEKISKAKHLSDFPWDQFEYYWPRLSKEIKRDALIKAYQLCEKNKEANQVITDKFLELLLLEDIKYKDLPEWAISRMLIYDWFYYLNKEDKDSADNYLRILLQ